MKVTDEADFARAEATVPRWWNDERRAHAVPFWSPAEIEASLADTSPHLQLERKVLAYPTETVYGFGGAVDRDSVERSSALKRRPPAKPFLLLIAGSDMLERLDLHLPSYATRLAARHWPGPLTLVLRGGERRVPPRLRGPEGGDRRAVDVASRRSSGSSAAYGDAITSTSANRPGVPPAMSARGDSWSSGATPIARGMLRVLDGGPLAPSAPSTVVDCTGRAPARRSGPARSRPPFCARASPRLIGDA